jgi:hypothetical protein
MNYNKFYAVRWFDSECFTSVNTVDYVMQLKLADKPMFYKYLVYELIETPHSFKQLTLMLPFDRHFNRVSSLKLHAAEKAKMKYHFNKLREATHGQQQIQT